MKTAILLALGAVLVSPPPPSSGAEDVNGVQGSQVRIFAGDAREIPGAIKIVGPGIVARCEVVTNDSKLVAVLPPGEAMPVALPRPGARPTGRLIAVDEESVIVKFDGQKRPFRVPRNVIASLEVNRGGHRNVMKGVGIGLGAGALAGVALGFAAGDDDPRTFMAYSAGEKALIAGVGLSLIGGAIGAIAELIDRPPRWEKAEVGHPRVGVVLEPRRHQSVIGLRVSF